MSVQRAECGFYVYVPVPVVVRTRPYDSAFYAQVGQTAWADLPDGLVITAAARTQADLGL